MEKEYIRGSVTTPSGEMLVAIKDEEKVYYAIIDEERMRVSGIGSGVHFAFDGWLDHNKFRSKGINPIRVFEHLEHFVNTGVHPYSDIQAKGLF